MNDLSGKEILDMGCGSGIVGVIASSLGAICTSVDINPEAVKCSEENFKMNNVKGTVIQSNLFDKLDINKKFDIIFFNPPYYNYEPQNDYEKGFGGGKDYRVIREFIGKSKDYLKKGGYLYLIISSDMKIETMFTILEGQGFVYNILQKIGKFFETFYIFSAFLKEN